MQRILQQWATVVGTLQAFDGHLGVLTDCVRGVEPLLKFSSVYC